MAVVGCGPRGMYCLDSLSRRLAQEERSRAVSVTIFEPAASPGAGYVYAIDQPHFLRMNFAAKYIHAWREQDAGRAESPSLVEWLGRARPELADPEAYVPRAIVGEYLTECFQRVVRRLTAVARVEVRRERVLDIVRVGDLWKLTSSAETLDVDEVMLAVGHEAWRPSAPAMQIPGASYVDQVFPTERQLSCLQIPPRQRVAVRGFGLTWIDAALAFTEGRGGDFCWDGDRCTYESSGDEPSVLLPFSRTGRPMLAKPIESRMQLPSGLAEVWEAGRRNLNRVSRPISRAALSNAVWGSIVKTAAEAIRCVHGRWPKGNALFADDIQRWFATWTTGPCDAAKTVLLLQQSVDVATGRTQPDIAWALGESWRRLYPALVQRISHGGLEDDAWPDFLQLAAEMERLAFGPPAENVGRILALVDCGLVDFSFLAGAHLKQSSGEVVLCNANRSTPVDVCVNAVIASPTGWDPKGPLAQLAAGQWIRRMNTYTGVEIDTQARPLSDLPDAPQGLAITGRATEGCVLGNDTLSRKLHSHLDSWAASVVERILL